LIDKVVYICHEFGGKKENAEKVARLIELFVDIYPNIRFISPIHAFGYLYDLVDYDTRIEYCLTFLDMCDEMWTFGSKSMSRGCMIEKEYCKKYKIPIIERGDYIDYRNR
jgi:hypothetical protein